MAAFASAAEAVDNRLVADRNKGEWTLVVIPDTQHYSQNRGNAPIAYMHDAFDWLVATRNQLNIKFVQGLGDLEQALRRDPLCGKPGQPRQYQLN